MSAPFVERPSICLRLTRSASDVLAARGARVVPDPALVHAQVGDHIQLEGEGLPLQVARRTWRMETGGPVLELLLDWPAR